MSGLARVFLRRGMSSSSSSSSVPTPAQTSKSTSVAKSEASPEVREDSVDSYTGLDPLYFEKHGDERMVRISKPSKNVMQYGTAYANNWKIEFDSQKRYESWLMGWASSQDPLSNFSLNFSSKEDAIRYCESKKLNWYVEEQPERKIRKKSYADNYSWDKRTRTSNK